MKTQFGRSMIEMLGVLAIIGVLSIGGIALYRRAVNNHHANTILDDANRLAFVITEKGNYPLDSVLSKGDFKESGIYELEPFQDIGPQQFSITVRNVPYGVCDALLEKAAVEYAVRVKEHGSENGTLYDLFHTDLCHDNNDIVLYFGDTDDLFDFPECGRLPNCAKYSFDCKCIECESGYQLSKNNSSDPDGQYCVANSCKSTGVDGCTFNEDCCKSTDFCAFLKPSSSSDKGTGTCKSLATYGTGTGDDRKTVGEQTFVHTSSGVVNYWTAESWCKRQKRPDGTPMEIASLRDLGCGHMDAGRYCTKSPQDAPKGDTNSGMGYEGSVLNNLQTTSPKWISGKHHTRNSSPDHMAYLDFSNSFVGIATKPYTDSTRAICH